MEDFIEQTYEKYKDIISKELFEELYTALHNIVIHQRDLLTRYGFDPYIEVTSYTSPNNVIADITLNEMHWEALFEIGEKIVWKCCIHNVMTDKALTLEFADDEFDRFQYYLSGMIVSYMTEHYR